MAKIYKCDVCKKMDPPGGIRQMSIDYEGCTHHLDICPKCMKNYEDLRQRVDNLFWDLYINNEEEK